MTGPKRAIYIRSRQKIVRQNAVECLLEQAKREGLKDCIIFQTHRSEDHEWPPNDVICLMTLGEMKEWKKQTMTERLKKSLVMAS